jgi:hypothetical protein
LDSLTNYAFTRIASNSGASFTATGKVHNPTDWEIHTISPAVTTYDVGGHGYAVTLGQVIHVSFNTPEGVGNLEGEYSFAEQLVGYTHVTGIKITQAGSCSVAGANGTIYHVQSPGADTPILSEAATACVSNGSGALLSYTSGITGGSAANAAHVAGSSNRFTVTAIGGVGPIVVPKASSTTTIPNVPSSLDTLPRLPTGFPAEVPTPPGKILSSTQISSTKWYLQLNEKSSSALAQYARQLQSKGFSVTSSTNTAGSDIEVLSKGSIQILLEQLSLSGQGVVLAVTVTSGG